MIETERTSVNVPPLARPKDLKVIRNYETELVAVNGYSYSQNKVLSTTQDDIEREISLRSYDRMETDPTVAKCKTILITSILSDELQLAPGATEEEVGPKEYENYVKIMEFCQRVVGGLSAPFRDTMSQLLGNAIRYGHGVAEIEWEKRRDGFSSKPRTPKADKGRFQAFIENWGLTSKKKDDDDTDTAIVRPQLKSEKIRLMPVSIKVKPRGTTRFVVDTYMNVLGLVPKYRDYKNGGISFNEIIDRDKFMVLTLNKRDEDPRGTSMYRPAWNWTNIKKEVPTELYRYILEETVPKSVGTLSKDAPPFEFDRDENGEVQYNDPETRKDPKMLTQAESMKKAAKNFRSGSGIVIPYEAKFEPYKKSGTSDADVFGKVLKVIDNQIEYAILLQVLAQSEGEHQARSASQQVAEVLYNLVFWVRWILAMLVLTDLFETAVVLNFGDWAVKYLPQTSFGDFVRRDWVKELEALADAYFKGFIDDTQRQELAMWMNLPRPGLSRFELGQQAAELDPTTGEARQPANNRPDKKNGDRNKGNSTEKRKNDTTKKNAKAFGRGSIYGMGHNSGWVRSAKGHIPTRY